MLNYMEIIWSLNLAVLGWLLNQYFKLREELRLMNVTLVKNYATNEAIEKLIANQSKMLETLTEIKIDQATIFERVKSLHEEAKCTIQTKPEK